MSNIFQYLWLILLAIYIISPVDLVPWHIFDDLIAAGVMFYLLYKNAKRKKQFEQYSSYSGYRRQENARASGDAGGPLTLDKAYRMLGVSASASWDEITRAYRDKISKSHPDKVTHLSKELQDRAQELTLELNEAYTLIKYNKGHA